MANYPTSASTDANLYVAVNSKATVLAGALTSVGGNNGSDIEVTDATGFPSTGFITIDQEAIAYTSILSGPPRFSGITRGADGTTATAHSSGATVKHNVIAAHHNVLKEEVKAVETDLIAVKSALNDADTPASTSADVKDRFDQVVSQIKTMHGQTNWYSTAKSYARLFKYQRPYLIWVSTTEIRIPNIFGTIVDILFPDGDYRSIDATADVELRKMVITRNAVLSGSHQGGLRATESEANNTWYAVYAVKTTDSATKFVAVGTTLLPLSTNEATLNSAFGTNGWVYLGMIRNGDNRGTAGDILKFTQLGNQTVFQNVTTATADGFTAHGTGLATTGGATTLTYTASFGTGAAQIPDNLTMSRYLACFGTITGKLIRDAAATYTHAIYGNGSSIVGKHAVYLPTAEGLRLENGPGSSIAYDILLTGFVDSVLGVGSNPYL